MNAIQIIETWLKENGYDGLYEPGECGCEIGDLCHCIEYFGGCLAGYKQPREKRGEKRFDFMIGPNIGPNKGGG